MKDKILQIVNDKFAKTRGGISLVDLGDLLIISQEELKTHLNALYKENKIVVRKGINLKYIYPK
jgi:predicted ArsR family transcriptional regulator